MLSFSPESGQPSKEQALEYYDHILESVDSIIDRETYLQDVILTFVVDEEEALSEENLDEEYNFDELYKRHEALKEALDKSIGVFETTPALDQDGTLKDQAMKLAKVYNKVANDQYKQLVELISKDEEDYQDDDNDKFNDLFNDKINSELEKEIDEFNTVQDVFAKKWGFSIESVDEA